MNNNVSGNNGSHSKLPKDVDNTVTKASSSAHAAVDSMASAADEAARKAKPAIEKVASMAHEAVDKAAGAAAPTAEWIAEKTDSLNATQKRVLDDACRYISANPMKAVGMAVVAGLLLSRIVL